MASRWQKLLPQTTARFDEKPFDEEQFIIDIQQALDEEEIHTTPVTIFSIPKSLMTIHPDSYIPHEVAIGPYHHTRTDLRQMEKHKLNAAKRNHKDFQHYKIEEFVKHLEGSEPLIRSSYNKALSFTDKTLAWMMAVDATFLFETLQICALNQSQEGTGPNLTSRSSYLMNLSRNKAAHNAVLRDILMLENQIPMFVLRKFVEMLFPSPQDDDKKLDFMLIKLCEELFPFKRVEDPSRSKNFMNEPAHLLDVLYHFLVPKVEGCSQSQKQEEEVASLDQENLVGVSPTSQGIMTFLFKLVSKVLPPMETFLKSMDGEDKKDVEGTTSGKPPLMEEIAIPSVTQLVKAGVQFEPTDGDISSISFDETTFTFMLPIISLDTNSDVILRNLVAYEACSATGPLVLARYTELMNGIIDTKEDAMILREKGIIKNRLKNDKEVADLWNGMSRSIRLTKVPFMDKAIEDVNRFYSGRWKLKLQKYMKKYVYGSWRVLTLLFALMTILLMGVQAFCSVYNCTRIVPQLNK